MYPDYSVCEEEYGNRNGCGRCFACNVGCSYYNELLQFSYGLLFPSKYTEFALNLHQYLHEPLSQPKIVEYRMPYESIVATEDGRGYESSRLWRRRMERTEFQLQSSLLLRTSSGLSSGLSAAAAAAADWEEPHQQQACQFQYQYNPRPDLRVRIPVLKGKIAGDAVKLPEPSAALRTLGLNLQPGLGLAKRGRSASEGMLQGYLHPMQPPKYLRVN